MIVMASGCIASGDRPDMQSAEGVTLRVQAAPGAIETTPDVCALAAELPADNICSLICDIPAMKDAMRARGDATGRCYDWLCQLPDSTTVYVGVCLGGFDPRPIFNETGAKI
jgi:hypothetical protein